MFNRSLMIKSGLLFIILATVLPINSPTYAGIIAANSQNQKLFQGTIKQQREEREQQRQEQAEGMRLGSYHQAGELQQQLRRQQEQLLQQQQDLRLRMEQLRQEEVRRQQEQKRQEELRQEELRQEELRRQMEIRL